MCDEARLEQEIEREAHILREKVNDATRQVIEKARHERMTRLSIVIQNEQPTPSIKTPYLHSLTPSRSPRKSLRTPLESPLKSHTLRSAS